MVTPVINPDGSPRIDENGKILVSNDALPVGNCCCNPCPLTEDMTFSTVEIFGNGATKYTDASVPNLADGGTFLGIFGESLNNEVWYYEGDGKQHWFFIRPADGVGCGDTPFFSTYGWDENRFGPGLGGNLNSETYCCEDTYTEGTYVGVGSDVTWEAFPA